MSGVRGSDMSEYGEVQLSEEYLDTVDEDESIVLGDDADSIYVVDELWISILGI